jgi:hypothetical protein
MAVWALNLGTKISDPEMGFCAVGSNFAVGIKALLAGMMAARCQLSIHRHAGRPIGSKIFILIFNNNATDRQQMRQSLLGFDKHRRFRSGLDAIIKNINEFGAGSR